MKMIENFVSQSQFSPEAIEFPAIKAISNNSDRPFWSVMIPTYNNTKYLEQTLIAVLEQAPSEEVMQIEVVDDCSTQGDVEEIVKRVGKGRISFYRNAQNLGLIGNWNACIARARGHWVHILHQDDLVMPGFYAKLQASIEQQPDIGAAFCRHLFINNEGSKLSESHLERATPGIIENWLERIGVQCFIECASIVVKRSVYEELGGYCSQAGYAADWEMWKRIASRYQYWFEPEILAAFRCHNLSETYKYIASGTNIVYLRRTIEISESYLPKDIAVDVSRRAREFYAIYAFNIAQQIMQSGNLEIAVTQIKEGLKCSKSSAVMNSLAQLFIKSEDLLRVFTSIFVDTKQENIFATINQIREQEQKVGFGLKDINLIVFPDWQQPEDLIYQELSSVIKNIINHSSADKIKLLVDNTGISSEEANFVISYLVFNLFNKDDSNAIKEPAISLTGDLTQKQWQALLPKISNRVVLNIDNLAAIEGAKAENIPVCCVEDISNILTASVDSASKKCLETKTSKIDNDMKIEQDILRVDIGCGDRKPQNFVGVDIHPGIGVDIVADLNKEFPFPDNSVDELRAHDAIEHLHDRINTMNEIWRVCKPGAKVDILVPSTDGRGAFQDPTHVSFWNINSFLYYCNQFPAYMELCRKYGFKGEFNAVKLEHIESPGGVIHVIAELVVVKPLSNSIHNQTLANVNNLVSNQAVVKENAQQVTTLTNVNG
ncbi:type 11 methyltransferase [Calothrix sp. NIES-4071]|nr:type 11 methyltransferase [Calothrix sp. NIES-4071]BAZ62710.1 type 11 methyltransferase [Calothrix sp. NIES-4105]